MISRLEGTLLEIDPSSSMLLLDVSGVGYEVEVSASVLAQAPVLGEVLRVHTHFVVREDAQLLFGFVSKAERELFRGFIRISGVGPKLALSLISALDPQLLVAAVRRNDISALTQVPGVGKKTAERLMVELKNRIEDLTATFDVSVAPILPALAEDDPAAQAVDALVALGYRIQDAQAAVAGVLPDVPNDTDVQTIIRQALRGFAQTGTGT